MGIDQNKELTFDTLKTYFKTDSKNCQINDFKIYATRDGSDFALSPNLLKRFSFGATSIKLVNIVGSAQDITLYVKGISAGNKGGYKPLKISYI